MADTPSPKDPNFYATVQRLQLEQWARDQNDGITLRSIHTTLKEHVGKDEAFHAKTGERLAALEADAERDAEEREADRFEAATGRFHALPPAAIETPAPLAITVNASGNQGGGGSHSRRPSGEKGGVLEEMRKSAGKILPIALVALLSSLFGYLARHIQALSGEPPPATHEHPIPLEK